MNIPTFEEAKQALIEKRGTPLDRFVAYWEPMSPEDKKFREMLKAVLEFGDGIKPVSKNVVEVSSPINAFWNPSTNQYEEKK